MSKPTLTEFLAGYCAAARFEDLPADTVRLAKRFLIDTLAAGIAGARTKVAEAALAAAQAATEGAAGSATVWGRSGKLPAPMAAMVNGTSAHALELDDFGGCGHSGAVVIPALRALVAGYYLAARTLEGAGGYRPVNDLGWHSTGICGSFGAAAASAKLLGLDSERFADALGIAGTFTGGIWAFLADGAMTKRLHPGKASENGLSAALLAQAGMSGPRKVLEAEWGDFFSNYAQGIATLDATLAGLGTEFRIARSGMKPYACCRGLHATVDYAASRAASSAVALRGFVHDPMSGPFEGLVLRIGSQAAQRFGLRQSHASISSLSDAAPLRPSGFRSGKRWCVTTTVWPRLRHSGAPCR